MIHQPMYTLTVLAIASFIQNANSDIGKHLVKVQTNTPSSDIHAWRKQWREKTCQKLGKLIQRKDIACQKLHQAIKKIKRNMKMSEHEKNYQNRTISLFQQELEESEDLIWHSMAWLQESLKGGYESLINIKESSWSRLEALRKAALREEQEYREILETEKYKKKHMSAEHASNIQSLLKEVLSDVAQAADVLEMRRDDHVFEQAIHNPNFGEGANIEVVVKLENEDTNGRNMSDRAAAAVRVVDAADNQFVLSKGKDTTVPHTDHHFVKDVIYVLLLAFPLGLVCHMMKLPPMFGYILTGIILGPSGFAVLKGLVQVESLGEFGVFFILFTVGLEFSPAHIRKVIKVTLFGCAVQVVVMVTCGVLVGNLLQVSTNESAFVAACLSLSSTPLVVKFLSDKEHQGDSDYVTILLGILVMQDVFLGFLVVLLPLLAVQSSDVPLTITHYVKIIFTLISSLSVTIVTTCLISFLATKMYHYLLMSSKEVLLLSAMAVVFTMLLITDSLGVSMELGCFLAGAALSGQGHGIPVEIEKLIAPVKDVFACLFFASIGLHVFPSFLAYELTVLITLTFAVIIFKFLVGFLALSFVLPYDNAHIKWIVAAGLAQVSEFSFVLSSRARRFGLVSREVYLLILSVTTLSLLLAPVVWKLSLWRGTHIKT